MRGKISITTCWRIPAPSLDLIVCIRSASFEISFNSLRTLFSNFRLATKCPPASLLSTVGKRTTQSVLGWTAWEDREIASQVAYISA